MSARSLAWLVVVIGTLVAGLAPRAAIAGEVRIVPSMSGHLGAWLAVGPIPGSPKGAPAPRQMSTALLNGEDATVEGRLGQSVTVSPHEGDNAPAPRSTGLSWRVVSAASGPIDVAQALEVGNLRPEAFAYLYGVLQVDRPFRGTLLLGSNDGARVVVDHQVVWSTDTARPERDDEDAVPLTLAAGDHPILIKLHHREGYWNVRARLVNERFVPPSGVTLRLPGTGDADVRRLGARMVDITVDRGLTATGFAPIVTASFPEGFPSAVDRELRIGAQGTVGGASRELFSASGGQLAMVPSGSAALQVRLPELTRDELEDVERGPDGLLTITAEIAGRKLEAPLAARPFMHEALIAADRALAMGLDVADPAVTRATIEHLRDRLVREVAQGSTDLSAQLELAQTLVAYLDDLVSGRDPLRTHAGIRRFAYRSDLDGQLSPFGVHVPRSFAEGRAAPGKRYPLVVALHGMNGKPISMIHWVFGHDDPAHDSEWEDRRAGAVEPFDGFIVAPHAHGNAMYRELGEVDVMRVVEWATRFFPIDRSRVTITGVSMGGTGAASVALHHPDGFAAAMPLCGYHSYFVRRDLSGKRMRSWERLLADQRSNVAWAENGLELPMFVWHGQRDLPEANSGVLIDRYLALGYSMQHEHPDVGHDVWRTAYDSGNGLAWLASQQRRTPQQHIVFRTDSPRYRDRGWVHLLEVPTDLSFAAIDARVVSSDQLDVVTDKVGAFALDRAADAGVGDGPLTVTVDGTKLAFTAGAAIEAHRGDHGWAAGARPDGPVRKRAGVSGPLRDVFFEPIVFVYGTQDPAMLAVNRETARHWARIRYGTDVRYPVLADDELDDSLAATHALFLVGSASSNLVVRDLDAALPFHVQGDAISATTSSGVRRWRGKNLGVAFIYPHPRHPEQYVVVIEGTTALGTYRSTALPELLPDFVVFGNGIAAARGQLVLGPARPLAAGLFKDDWTLGSIASD